MKLILLKNEIFRLLVDCFPSMLVGVDGGSAVLDKVPFPFVAALPLFLRARPFTGTVKIEGDQDPSSTSLLSTVLFKVVDGCVELDGIDVSV